MAESKKHVYDESKIKTLSSLEHIRLRTGMYIGRIGDGSHYDDGCYILLKEVIDNAIDEFIMGHGKEVQINIEGTRRQRARFRARHSPGQSGGLRLQDQHRRQIQRRRLPIQRRPQRRRHQGGQRACPRISWCAAIATANLSRPPSRPGKLKNEKSGKDASEPDGTFIRFVPDPEIFKESAVPPGIRRAAPAALQLPQHRAEAHLQRADLRLAQRPAGPGDGGFARRQRRADLSAAALREQDAGILFHPQQQPLRRDVLFLRQRPVHRRRRHAPERLSRGPAQGRQRILPRANSRATTCASAWSARWPSGSRTRSSSRKPRTSWATPKSAPTWSTPCARNCSISSTATRKSPKKSWPRSQDTQQLRKELQEVKKLARERAKAITIRIPQLKDCKIHFDKAKGKGSGSMIFLTEGQSAAGSDRQLPRRQHPGHFRAQRQAAQRLGPQARHRL